MTTSIDSGGRRIVHGVSLDGCSARTGQLGVVAASRARSSCYCSPSRSGLGYWSGRVLSPIDRLAELARTAPGRNRALAWHPRKMSKCERLVGTLNGFLARLRDSNRAKDRFYAAASHELRTPLARVGGLFGNRSGPPARTRRTGGDTARSAGPIEAPREADRRPARAQPTRKLRGQTLVRGKRNRCRRCRRTRRRRRSKRCGKSRGLRLELVLPKGRRSRNHGALEPRRNAGAQPRRERPQIRARRRTHRNRAGKRDCSLRVWNTVAWSEGMTKNARPKKG